MLGEGRLLQENNTEYNYFNVYNLFFRSRSNSVNSSSSMHTGQVAPNSIERKKVCVITWLFLMQFITPYPVDLGMSLKKTNNQFAENLTTASVI